MAQIVLRRFLNNCSSNATPRKQIALLQFAHLFFKSNCYSIRTYNDIITISRFMMILRLIRTIFYVYLI